MSEHWTERLSEYLDGGLSAAERAACRAHLAECGECAGALEELRAVVAQASLLPELPPERDLWPAIEERLAPRRATAPEAGTHPDPQVVPLASRRKVALTVPQLIAAAIALVVVSAGTVRLMVPSGDAPAMAVAPQGEATQLAAGGAVLFTSGWDDAVQELELEFEHRRAELDPETIRVVEENLSIIDAAIDDANRALAEDPSSAFLSTHLASAMRQKVDLLRRVTAIERTDT